MHTSTFKLEQLFGSKTRARLLGLFLSNPSKLFFVRELTRLIDAQLNSVRRELKNLVDLGIISEKVGEGRSVKEKITALSEKKKYYEVNTDFVLYEDLRALFKKVQILLKQGLVQEIALHGQVDLLVFTGRFVDRTDVPTDILIVGRVDQTALQTAVAAFEAEMGHEINYTLMPREEFVYRREVSDRFLAGILEGERVVMIDKILS